MSATDATNGAAKETERTATHARETVRSAKAAIDEGRRAIPELAKTAQQTFSEQVDRLSGQARDAADMASEQLDNAKLYLVERVQERPFTATLAALGAGFVLGLLFAGSRR